MWSVKTPKGKLITSVAREHRIDSMDEFIMMQIKHGFIKDIPELHGPDYFEAMWAKLEDCGYELVQCFVKQCHDDEWSWPELMQLPHQACLL